MYFADGVILLGLYIRAMFHFDFYLCLALPSTLQSLEKVLHWINDSSLLLLLFSIKKKTAVYGIHLHFFDIDLH